MCINLEAQIAVPIMQYFALFLIEIKTYIIKTA